MKPSKKTKALLASAIAEHEAPPPVELTTPLIDGFNLARKQPGVVPAVQYVRSVLAANRFVELLPYLSWGQLAPVLPYLSKATIKKIKDILETRP